MGLFSAIGSVAGAVIGGPAGAAIGGGIGGAADGLVSRRDDKKAAKRQASNANRVHQANAANAKKRDQFSAALSRKNMVFASNQQAAATRAAKEQDLFYARESRVPTVNESAQRFDFDGLVASAQSAGINPLTALRTVGAPVISLNSQYKAGKVSEYAHANAAHVPDMPDAPTYRAADVQPAAVASPVSYIGSGVERGLETARGIQSLMPDPRQQERERLELDLMRAELSNLTKPRPTVASGRTSPGWAPVVQSYGGTPMQDDYTRYGGVFSGLGAEHTRPTQRGGKPGPRQQTAPVYDPSGREVHVPRNVLDRLGMAPYDTMMPGDWAEVRGEIPGEAENVAATDRSGEVLIGSDRWSYGQGEIDSGQVVPGEPQREPNIWQRSLEAIGNLTPGAQILAR